MNNKSEYVRSSSVRLRPEKRLNVKIKFRIMKKLRFLTPSMT